MLRIGKNSWHYWLWKLGRDENSRPKNLCKYFWHIAIVKVLLPAILASFVLLGVATLGWLIWGHPVEFGVGLMLLVGGTAAVVGVIKLTETYVEHRREVAMTRPPKPKKPKKEKKPNIFFEFLKARKRKMCPLIEVVDD
jgi:hypothetical protein